MSKVEKPKNAPDPWFTTSGMSEWNYDWDDYFVFLKKGPEYVNDIYEPEDGSYLVHDRWNKLAREPGIRERTAVAVDNPPAFFADKETDNLEIDGYNLKEFFRWCITNDPELSKKEKEELLGYKLD